MIQFMIHSQDWPEKTEDKLHLFSILINYPKKC
jgi:hypothetical protein